jgi:GNAT superfamily N-acetyltransferase
MRPAVRLDALHFHELVTHFLALPAVDRRLRFGCAMSDEAVIEYVGRIDFERDEVFGIVDPVLDIAGALHLDFGTNGVELGLSVLPPARGAGIGACLLARAGEAARERGASRLYVRDLVRNEAMKRLAQRAGVPIITAHNGVDGALQHALAAERAAPLGAKSPVVLVDATLRVASAAGPRTGVVHAARRFEMRT